jgi:hypothetical protein
MSSKLVCGRHTEQLLRRLKTAPLAPLRGGVQAWERFVWDWATERVAQGRPPILRLPPDKPPRRYGGPHGVDVAVVRGNG